VHARAEPGPVAASKGVLCVRNAVPPKDDEQFAEASEPRQLGLLLAYTMAMHHHVQALEATACDAIMLAMLNGDHAVDDMVDIASKFDGIQLPEEDDEPAAKKPKTIPKPVVPRTEAEARELISKGQGKSMTVKQLMILCKSRSLATSMTKGLLLAALTASFEAHPTE